MQNNYQGPPEDFAMVVPVPVVLQKENVKTLPRDVFARVDTLARAAARRVLGAGSVRRRAEYDEDDARRRSSAMPARRGGAGAAASLGVKIEAQFAVGEYEIVILSAKDSTGLETLAAAEQVQDPRRAPSRCSGRTSSRA